jgi:hypothetical protein
MAARTHEFDVAEAFTTPLFRDDLDAALFAGDALVTDLLVFAAMAFVVLGRTEDLFAEETSHFRFLAAVVDGLRLRDFAMRPGSNRIGGG